jgi:hypothetical protein
LQDEAEPVQEDLAVSKPGEQAVRPKAKEAAIKLELKFPDFILSSKLFIQSPLPTLHGTLNRSDYPPQSLSLNL